MATRGTAIENVMISSNSGAYTTTDKRTSRKRRHEQQYSESKPKQKRRPDINEIHRRANEIYDLNVTHDAMAKFAVLEHNNNTNDVLKFVKLVGVNCCWRKDVLFFLTLEAEDRSGQVEVYLAVINHYLASNTLIHFQEHKEQQSESKSEPVCDKYGIHRSATPIYEKNILHTALARFAVSEHNKNTNDDLEFVWLAAAKCSFSGVCCFFLVLKAKDCSGKVETYVAEINHSPSTNNLVRFELIGGKLKV